MVGESNNGASMDSKEDGAGWGLKGASGKEASKVNIEIMDAEKREGN